ncbi:unnamed protein product [Candidula unifasciata]|uniref:Ninjurin-1 n=1 Tax=Candidula unifasciata TaxID=100452 RepID=A0A8S3Z2F6_9EUPU|nr:unnamed protein product [Candidula unifasciata]
MELQASENKAFSSDLDWERTGTMRKSTVRPLSEDKTRAGVAKDAKKELDDDSDGYDPLSAESLGPLMSSNQFGMRKIAAQALMDVALMMANISQLRTLLTAGVKMDYYITLIALVILSLALQLLFALLIFVMWTRESDQHRKDEYLKTLRNVIEVTKLGSTADKEKARDLLVRKQEDYNEDRLTSHLNYITMILVFAITVVNMFITGFGIKLEESTDALNKTVK